MRIDRLMLASKSSFRRSLLESTGIVFSTCDAQVDERSISADSPLEIAKARSEAKALAAAKQHPDVLVIGADQVLGFENKGYGKAATREEAGMRLREFSGQSHFLHSGFSLALNSNLLNSEVVSANMRMRPLTDIEIEAYLRTQEWMGTAGCYQYENGGRHLFEEITGDQSTIIGLPLCELLSALRKIGVNGLTNPGGPWEIHG